jgi:hypothetical protein
MPHKFLRGDTVRHIGSQELFVVAQIDEPSGLKYILKPSDEVVGTTGWQPEEQLELVKRASDDETGLGIRYIT